jgi:hypothetical protein
LNARDPYAIYEDPTRGRNDYHQNQAGFTVGGPVLIPKLYNRKNKFFFFTGYEALRNDAQNTILAYVPTARERAGDFGEWLQRFPGSPKYIIYDPFSFNAVTQERTPYPNNIISNVNPRAAEYVSHFPLPNYTSGIEEDFRNWKGTQDQGLTGDNIVVRGDYTFGSKDFVYSSIPATVAAVLSAADSSLNWLWGEPTITRASIPDITCIRSVRHS